MAALFFEVPYIQTVSQASAQSADHSPLRILHLTNRSDAGGISRYLVDLSRAMAWAGHHSVIAGARGADHEKFEDADIEWIDARVDGGPVALGRAVRTIRAELEARPPDVIHAHYRRASLVGRRLARRWGRPMLFTLHLTDLPLGGFWRWFSDWGDLTHAPSEDARRWLVETVGLDRRRVVVIPHGVDTERYPLADDQSKTIAREKLGVPPQARLAAYVGRFDDPKNEHWLIDLAAASREQLSDLHVVLMGGGPNQAQLRRRIEQAGVGDRVRLMAYQDPLPLYQAADALLLASAREGFSLACAEAMSTGCPVLRTNTAGTSEMIRQGVTGQSVDLDHDQFIHTAIELLADREKLRWMGQAAASQVRTHLRFDQQMDRTIELYQHLASSGNALAPGLARCPAKGRG